MKCHSMATINKQKCIKIYYNNKKRFAEFHIFFYKLFICLYIYMFTYNGVSQFIHPESKDMLNHGNI